MAKVKPLFQSDLDSVVEFSISASESELSPQEDLSEIDLLVNNLAAYDSDMSEVDYPFTDHVSSSRSRSALAEKKLPNIDGLPHRNVKVEIMKKRAGNCRKRSIQDDKDFEESEPHSIKKHQSKNAINARINRIKKKKYIQSLENKLDAYQKECNKWQSVYQQKIDQVQALQNQVQYLKSVIKNETELGKLVKHFNLFKNSSSQPPNFSRPQTLREVGMEFSHLNSFVPSEADENSNDLLFSLTAPNKSSDSDISSTVNSPNFYINCLTSDIDASGEDDITFKSIFPSACDYLNFDLPENPVEDALSFDPIPAEVDPGISLDGGCVGICLHLSSRNELSMEFCANCSRLASHNTLT